MKAKTTLKMIRGAEREERKRQGWFDNRFRLRVIINKKKEQQKYQARNKNQ